MIVDSASYEEILAMQDGVVSWRQRAIQSFLQWLERKMGMQFIFDRRRSFRGQIELQEPVRLSKILFERKIITGLFRHDMFPDMPVIRYWKCRPGEWTAQYPGGAALTDRPALVAALAESLERYIWTTQTDFFIAPVIASANEMELRKCSYVKLDTFAGYSQEERAKSLKVATQETPLQWIKAHSLVRKASVYIPAQVVSGAVSARAGESKVRELITTGLATWFTQAGAQASGFLEIVERDAYMITWLNQLTMPRISINSLLGHDSDLDILLERCARYRYRVHVVKLCTDAPAHAVAVVLEDTTASIPRFSIGLNAHFKMCPAVFGALTEAIRAHHGNRRFLNKGDTEAVDAKEVTEIGHFDRIYYWAKPENAERLEFFVAGEEQVYEFDAPWENDTKESYLERAVAWCADKDYDLLSVSMGVSKANPTPWHIEMVIVPQMTPTYLYENRRQTGGARIKNVPAELGYTPLPSPFIAAPHPFA